MSSTRLIEKLWSNHGPPIVASRYFTSFPEPPASRIFNQLPLARVQTRVRIPPGTPINSTTSTPFRENLLPLHGLPILIIIARN